LYGTHGDNDAVEYGNDWHRTDSRWQAPLRKRSFRRAAGADDQTCRRNAGDEPGDWEGSEFQVSRYRGESAESGPGSVGSGDFEVAVPRLGPALVEVGAMGLR